MSWADWNKFLIFAIVFFALAIAWSAWHFRDILGLRCLGQRRRTPAEAHPAMMPLEEWLG